MPHTPYSFAARDRISSRREVIASETAGDGHIQHPICTQQHEQEEEEEEEEETGQQVLPQHFQEIGGSIPSGTVNLLCMADSSVVAITKEQHSNKEGQFTIVLWRLSLPGLAEYAVLPSEWQP